MSIILKDNVTVVKVFNNNIVLVKEKGVETILFEKGIGFGKKFGEILKAGLVIEKLFRIENEQNQKNIKEVMNRVDDDFFALCEEFIAEISEDLGEELNENIHIGLIDHVHLAVKRIRENEQIENPFLVEIKTLYKKEFKLALKLAEKINESLKVSLPEGEIGLIALHIHSSRNNGKLSTTIKCSSLSNSIVGFIEGRLNIKINKESLDYARFLTHIRFAIERILTDNPVKNDLIKIIKREYKISYKIAKESAKILEQGLDKKVTEDEICYLAMHIERFRVSIGRN